jgi:DNA-binding response OmpR family regulator
MIARGRQMPQLQENTRFQRDTLLLDYESRRVEVRGEPIALTYQEFELLALLMRAPNQVLSHHTICGALWGGVGRKELKRLSVVVSHLRDKLANAHPYVIAGVRCRGYGLMSAQPFDGHRADDLFLAGARPHNQPESDLRLQAGLPSE